MEEEKEKVLIVSTDKGREKNRLYVKVRRKIKKGFTPNEYTKVVNIRDANDMSLFFEDLSILLNAPVESAFRKYMERKGQGFPF